MFGPDHRRGSVQERGPRRGPGGLPLFVIARLMAVLPPRPPPVEEVPMRGQGSEPVELRPGIAARREARLAELEQWAWRRMRAMRAFFTHITVFVGINFMLFLIDESTAGRAWFYIPFLSWGFILALHGLHAYDMLPWTTQGWEQRKVRELMLGRMRDEREMEE